jgi:hypothetical protein
MKQKKIIVQSSLILLLLAGALSAGLKDRAFGTHNVGKMGYFTTNIGQFYPYGGQVEQTLEYPINSGKICMYRQCLMIGVPVNVVSAADGRYEEFDAVGGYNAGNGEIAMSDNPLTWPVNVNGDPYWPVQDSLGNPVIRSQQDSYCVYSDSTNWRYKNNGEEDKLLDFRVHQSIWSWGVPGADKFVVLKFEIENTRDTDLDSVYFNFYSDLDIGGISSGEEWADDCIDFDKDRELVRFYDSDNYSDEWMEADPFQAGIVFLETPNGEGITDWHWIDVAVDEVAVNSAVWDSISWYQMISDTSYFHKNGNVADYFHLGENPSNGTRFDDPNTTRITDAEGNLIGGAMVAYIVNGPATIPAKGKVTYLVGVVVGDDEADLLAVTDELWAHYDNGFNIPVVPAPELSAEVGDREVDLYWSNALDIGYSNPAAGDSNDLEGYILYRSTDPLLRNWTTLDTIPMQFKSETQLRAEAYHYEDEQVNNGFRYFYSLAAYRHNILGNVEESVRLAALSNLANQSNAVEVYPQTLASVTAAEMERIRVVPNPFVISAVWDEARIGNTVFGEPIRNIAFTYIPQNAVIRIFTTDGDLVQTLRNDGQTGRVEWNLLTSEQRPAGSGIYFYHVKAAEGEKTGRFAIVR